MATLFLPFGYPGYPRVQMAEHIAKSERWLRDIGVDLVAAPNVIVLAAARTIRKLKDARLGLLGAGMPVSCEGDHESALCSGCR